MRLIAERMRLALTAIAENPRLAATEVALLGEEERADLLARGRGAEVPVPDVAFAELFTRQALHTPDRVAVQDDRLALTYRELDARANGLAHHLVGQGAGPEQLVALALPRSIDLVVSVLAVAKSGAAYLPMDITHPEQRLRYILDDAAPVHLITTADSPLLRRARGVAHDHRPGRRHGLRPVRHHRPRYARGPPPAGHPAYVIYTSGSTGRPKGVMIPNSALTDYLLWSERAYPGVGGNVPLHSSVAFDLTVTSLLVPLICGGRIVVEDLSGREAEVSCDSDGGVGGRRRCRRVGGGRGLLDDQGDARPPAAARQPRVSRLRRRPHRRRRATARARSVRVGAGTTRTPPWSTSTARPRAPWAA